jgi:hypothetical protein
MRMQPLPPGWLAALARAASRWAGSAEGSQLDRAAREVLLLGTDGQQARVQLGATQVLWCDAGGCARATLAPGALSPLLEALSR